MNGEGDCEDATHDTGKVDMQQVVLDELHRIGRRIERLEHKTDQAITDLHMIHSFHRSYVARLEAVERVCSEVPLKTVRPTPSPPSDDENDGDR